MRPARAPSLWVKIRPWYYTDREPLSRAEDLRQALGAEQEAEGEARG